MAKDTQDTRPEKKWLWKIPLIFIGIYILLVTFKNGPYPKTPPDAFKGLRNQTNEQPVHGLTIEQQIAAKTQQYGYQTGWLEIDDGAETCIPVPAGMDVRVVPYDALAYRYYVNHVLSAKIGAHGENANVLLKNKADRTEGWMIEPGQNPRVTKLLVIVFPTNATEPKFDVWTQEALRRPLVRQQPMARN